jgi:hypothetical protein
MDFHFISSIVKDQGVLTTTTSSSIYDIIFVASVENQAPLQPDRGPKLFLTSKIISTTEESMPVRSRWLLKH